jgi:hypothetical protein
MMRLPDDNAVFADAGLKENKKLSARLNSSFDSATANRIEKRP